MKYLKISTLVAIIVFSIYLNLSNIFISIPYTAQTAAVADFDSSLVYYNSFDSESTAGKIGNAKSFNGTSDKVSIGGISVTAPFSIGFWINKDPNQPTGATAIISDGSTNHEILLASSNALRVYWDAFYSFTKNINSNEWHHLMLVVDASGNGKWYIDGVLDNTFGPISGGATFTTIGSEPGGNPYKGMLDDFRIYNQALDTDKVNQLYSLTSTGTGGTGSTPTTCTTFTYSAWSTCSNGSQTRSVTSSLPSGCTGGTPDIVQSCTSTVTPQTGATTYYVDYSSGNDNNNGTSQNTPWKHIKGDMSATGIAGSAIFRAGDIIQFKGGVIYPNKIETNYSGTSGNPITYKGTGWGVGKAILEGPANIYDTETVAFDIGASYITFDGFDIRKRKSAGFLGTAYGSHDIIIKNNIIHDIGDINSAGGSAIYLVGFSDVLVENNEIYNTNYTAIDFANDDANVTIRGNHLYNGNVDGIGYGVKSGNMTIEKNIIHGFNNNINHGDGMQILSFPGTLIVRDNVMYDNGQEIFIEPYSNPAGASPAGTAYVYNNILYCTSAVPAGQCGNGIGVSAHNHIDGVYIFNNTIAGYNSGWGGISIDPRDTLIAVLGSVKPFGTVQIKNNILYNSKAQSMSAMTLSDSFVWDYDLYYAPGINSYLPGNGNNGADLTQFRIEHPTFEVHGKYGDPLFMNIIANNFMLNSGSPAINAGTASSFFSNDINSTTRPQGGAWDIGAYEYTGGGTVTPPTVTGDFNGDGVVNSVDLSVLMTYWNLNNSSYDLNHDGIINSLDYVIMVQNWTA